MNPEDFHLLERYIDGTVSNADIPRLRTLLTNSGEARAMLRTLATIDVGLQDLAEGKIDSPFATPAPRANQSNFPKALLAITTLVLIALGTSLFFQPKPAVETSASDRHIARITGMGGVVVWTGNGGKVSTDLKVGTPLTGGTIEGASPTSWVELEFDDGSTFALSGDSRLTFSDLGQKVLHLKEGDVTSAVEPQPAETPMLVYTQNALMEVLGTEFKVSSEIDATSLAVTEGTVRFKRLSDGRSVDVPANQHVRATGGVEFSPQPIPAVASQWNSQLDSPYNLFGKWLPKSETAPPRLKLVPHQHTTPDDQKVMVQFGGVSIPGRGNETVLLHDDSKIRVRGIARLSQRIVFGVSIHGADNGFGGTFMSFDPSTVFWKKLSDFTTMDSDDKIKAFEVVLDASDFLLNPELEQSKQQFKASPINSIVTSFFCLSPIEESRMEITEVEIFRSGINESLFGEDGKEKDDPAAYSAEQIMGFLDQDGDKRISKQEAEASPELSPAFAFVDISKDGFIDMQEAEAMVAYMKKKQQANKPAAGRKQTTAKQIIDSMDKNKDGKIGKAEASEELKPFFGDYDSNGDGFIDEKEGQAIAKFVSEG